MKNCDDTNFIFFIQELAKYQQSETIVCLKDKYLGIFIQPPYEEKVLLEANNIYNEMIKNDFNVKYFVIFDDMPLEYSGEANLLTIRQLIEDKCCDYILFLPSAPSYVKNLYMFFERVGISSYMLQNSNIAYLNYELIMGHLSNLYSTYCLLKDDFSKKSFLAAIKGRISGQLKDYIYAAEPQYFLNGFSPNKDDIAIDGGSFDGLTSVDFASKGANVYSFELDTLNYNLCRKNAQKFHFQSINKGLWSSKKTASYISNNTGSHINTGNNKCELIDIDSFCLDNNLRTVNYIKLDVEGAELEVLKGAFLTIAKFKPKMAISVYHKPEDLYEIPSFVKKIRDDYELCFRHYRIDTRNYGLTSEEKNLLLRYDLSLQMKTIYEMILYCR